MSDQPIDLEGVRKGDALLDEAERLREESGRKKRQLSPEDLENIYMGEKRQTYTVSEAAELTGYHPESIRRHIRDDKLKAAQTGKGNYRISRSELARWWREELGGGELFNDTSPEQKANDLVNELKGQRESGSWPPNRGKVEQFAKVCARTTYEFFQSTPMVEWDNPSPKPSDWNAFHEAFGYEVEPDDEITTWFVEAYEQTAIEKLEGRK